MGDGQGEQDSSVSGVEMADPDCGDTLQDTEMRDEDEENEMELADLHPLIILYDCETTGFSIYNDHITDIGAKVLASPIPLSQPTFCSLVRTARNIPAAGIQK